MNPMQLLNGGSNPQQLMMNMLQQQAQNNPMMSQILTLAQQGNSAELEKLARNMCQSAGKDYDKEMAQFKKTMGL